MDGNEEGVPAMGASAPQRQVPQRSGRDVQPVHPGLDQLLQPLLSDAVASNPEKDRCLCHSMGSPQIQADGPLDQGREGLVRSAAPRESNTLCPLATMPRQRPNIGSRMNREVHVRFWERLEVKALRATRQNAKYSAQADVFRSSPESGRRLMQLACRKSANCRRCLQGSW